MTISEITKQVVDSGQCVLLRMNPDQIKGKPIEYSVKPYEGNKGKWTLFDITTASAMQAVSLKIDRAQSFLPIVSIRGEVLHNNTYSNTMRDGDLLLIDSGTESSNISAVVIFDY